MAELKQIEVEMIVLPDELMRRESMAQDIDPLIEDIAARGLLQPIGATMLADGRFRLRWGARRTLAHRMMGRTTIAAMVMSEDEGDETEDMARENYQRVQVSDGEDVRFIMRYMQEKKVSANECSRRLRIPYARVLRAAAIVGGNADVVQALYDGKITAAVAEELVQLPSLLHTQNLLFHAIRTQCAAKFIRVWREQIERDGLDIGVEHVQQVIAEQSQINYANTMQCGVCEQFRDYQQAGVHAVCHTCWAGLIELKNNYVRQQQEQSQEVSNDSSHNASGPPPHEGN